MEICTIASGSSGNCIYVGSGDKHILIDAGISRKRIVEGLEQIGVAPENLDGIFVTHEHSDHISGIPMMSKMFKVPVFATGGTLDEICYKDKKGDISTENLYQVYPDEEVDFGELKIKPFSISHDASDPVCYTVEKSGKKFGMATDLGCYDKYIIDNLNQCDILLLEANHDISMLEAGKYPYSLKRRILGRRGHLANEDAGRLLGQLCHKNLKHVFLAHLSKENNYPKLAYEAVKCQLWEDYGMAKLPFEMEVASRNEPSKIIKL